jgi:hypothetical protein
MAPSLVVETIDSGEAARLDHESVDTGITDCISGMILDLWLSGWVHNGNLFGREE